ncbi:hypothetical protein HDU96_010880 [Phlyctochytrium bullatum]|nr:hypothetical protein HDU96_010880 [Phlyctochytrium bullatum]
MAGAIVVAANIPALFVGKPTGSRGVTLRLSRQVLPQIFSATITRWNDTRILDCQDDPAVRQALAGVREPIIPLIRSPGSGTTFTFLRALRKMDPDFPTADNIAQLVGASRIEAISNQAVGAILSSIPYTITYMDTHELETSFSLSSSITIATVAVQNRNDEYVIPTSKGVELALREAVNASTIDVTSQNLLVVDSPARGAYPITVVTNFVFRWNNISDDVDKTMWTLRFMWHVLTNSTVTVAAENRNFTALTNTDVRNFTLAKLMEYRHKGAVLFNQSICDLMPGQANPCKNGGFCPNQLPFQPASVTCICRNGYVNRDRGDCSERPPMFPEDVMTYVQLGGAALSGVVVVMTWTLMLLYSRHHKIRSIAPSCCNLILAGCLVGTATVVVYAATPSDIVCKIRVFFPALSFGLVFGMVMLKTYRIYLIFGYRHISAARSIRNWTLINLTLVIAAVEIALSLSLVTLTQPVLSQVYVAAPDSAGSANSGRLAQTSWLTCRPSDGRQQLSQIIEAVLFTFNGGIMLVCLFLAFKTRGAYKRYVESKAIGLTTYVVALSLLVALPVIYAIPIETVRTNTVINGVRGALLVILSTGVPLIMFAPRILEALENKRDTEDDIEGRPAGKSGNGGGGHPLSPLGGAPSSPFSRPVEMSEAFGASESGVAVKGMENWNVQALTYDVGVRRNRFASVWQSAALLLLPELDMVFFVDSMKTGNTITSMRLSTTEVQGMIRTSASNSWNQSYNGGGDGASSGRKQRGGVRDKSGEMHVPVGGKWGSSLPGAGSVGGGGLSELVGGPGAMDEGSSAGSSMNGATVDRIGYGVAGSSAFPGPMQQSTQLSASTGGGHKMITLLPRGDRKGYFVEFANEDRLRSFYNMYEAVRARASGVSALAGRIVLRSQRLNNSPIINVIKGGANGRDNAGGVSGETLSSPATPSAIMSFRDRDQDGGRDERFPAASSSSSSSSKGMSPLVTALGYPAFTSPSSFNGTGSVPGSPTGAMAPSSVSTFLAMGGTGTGGGPSNTSPSRFDPNAVVHTIAMRTPGGGFVAPPPSLPAWALQPLPPPPATAPPALVRRKSDVSMKLHQVPRVRRPSEGHALPPPMLPPAAATGSSSPSPTTSSPPMGPVLSRSLSSSSLLAGAAGGPVGGAAVRRPSTPGIGRGGSGGAEAVRSTSGERKARNVTHNPATRPEW